MKLKLNYVASTGSWAEVEEEGIFLDNLAATDKLALSDKNLRSEKRVTVFIHEKGKDQPAMLSCSEDLSKSVRKALANGKTKREILAVLLTLRVITNAAGTFLIPNAGETELFGIAELKKETVTFEELVAF